MNQRPTLGSLPRTGSFRGQPLAIMLAVLALWIGLRASLGAPPPLSGNLADLGRAAARIETVARGRASDLFGPAAAARTMAAAFTASSREGRHGYAVAEPLPGPWFVASGPSSLEPFAGAPPAATPPDAAAPGFTTQAEPPEPPELDPARGLPLAHPLAAHTVSAGARKPLSVDGWLFLRDGGIAEVGVGPLAPSYGRSQFGAVLRYGLAAHSPHLPQAYLRATGSIDSREADLAAGISIQPLRSLPLRAHGELRLSRLGEAVELRPAVFVAAGIDETVAPFDLRLRGYAQAGYVGGEFATGFADGSLVVERETARLANGALAVGAGAWGGAQEGTARLDAGPTASIDLRIGQGRARLAADYRFRVAGDAEPSSGAALTLSTSF